MSDRCPQPSAVLPDESLRDELRDLPNLAAPPAIWNKVRERSDRALRRHRRRAPLALAASALAGVAAILLLALPWQDSSVDAARAGDIAALLERSQRLEAGHRAMRLLPPTDTERLLQARIGGIDASLNDQLLHEAASSLQNRERLLRERVDLMESLMHIEEYRQRELLHQAVF